MKINANQICDETISHPEKIREQLIKLHQTGETAEDLVEFVTAFRARSVPYTRAPELAQTRIYDICGTGGSGRSRISLSTALAVKLSNEFHIAKHGNKAASGRVGSFDLIDKIDAEPATTAAQINQNLSQNKCAFVFAPAFHPALGPLAPIRRSIPHATIFNLLGPLLNPVDIDDQVMGISDSSKLEILAEAFVLLGRNGLIVHDTKFGLDDISIGGQTRFAKIQNGEITYGEFVPEDFGIDRVSDFSQISGGDVVENAAIFGQLLSGTATPARQSLFDLNYQVISDYFRGKF